MRGWGWRDEVFGERSRAGVWGGWGAVYSGISAAGLGDFVTQGWVLAAGGVWVLRGAVGRKDCDVVRYADAEGGREGDTDD